MSGSYPHGSYGWWKANYAFDAEYAKVCQVLAGMGWDVSKTEIDHFPPDSTYAGAFANVAYEMKPAFPLIYPLHQPSSGQSYGGGYATSSKSSNLAKEYRSILTGNMQGGDFYAALKQDLIDKMNLSLHATSSNKSGMAGQRTLFNNLLRPAVDLARHNGWISEMQHFELLSMLYNG
ncbi:hypothetical protein J5Y09_22490 [Roseomonas sp. PWR1]|uniref:Uncharacterized protein n=1 Tax=Roseomonas nitratireducens TaxID=2820810 RepID=A0ABS4AZD9_9PROT|nr:hypothetical protein [Neoroseomonas nitratireducens]MBP0466714.1 hypothetical protein [Neoroseomonas nitratireducens]